MKKAFYIFSSGEIKRKENTLFFQGKDGKRRFLPVENIKELLIFGEVSLNKRVLELFSKKEIIVHFFNHYDYYTGSFYPREHYNSGYMILRQAEHYIDEGKRLYLAKEFVKGAVENSIKNLSYYERRGVELGNEIGRIRSLVSSIDLIESIDELMAIEGNIKDIYYRAFDFILRNTDFRFERRSRRPPMNYLNSLISFINSLVYTEVLSSIYKTHLDPRIGYLHSTNFRRFTLNLDVSEIFKPVVGDRLIFSLINRGIVKKSDFDKRSGGLRFKERALKEIAKRYDERLSTTIKVKSLGRKVSYRRLIMLELYKIEKHLIGEKEYKSFVMEW